MKVLFFLVLLVAAVEASACMRMTGSVNINGETLKIDQKVDHDQVYSFMKSNYIVNVTLPSGQKEGTHFIDIKVDQKKDQKIETVSRGRIYTKDGMEAEMVSRDNKTNETFTYKVVVKNI